MTELEELRRRAYGPDPERLDQEELERLRQLEQARKPARVPNADLHRAELPSAELHHEPPPLLPTTTVLLEETPDAPPREWLRALGRAVRWSLTRASRIRRSTVVVVLSVAAVAAVVITSLVVVERVQSDPLGAGAQQVARLSIDSSFDIPEFYKVTEAEGGTVDGFDEFHGMTSVVTTGGFSYLSGGRDSVCLNVYSTQDMAPDSNSFSGLLLGGCTAGGFPAMAQFDLGAQAVPGELRSAMAQLTALQFVYDSTHREVVVFATK